MSAHHADAFHTLQLTSKCALAAVVVMSVCQAGAACHCVHAQGCPTALSFCLCFVQVAIDALDGCVMHLPCDLPEPRHIRPPKDILSGRYDLLAYVKASAKPTAIGHLQLDMQQALGEDLVFRRSGPGQLTATPGATYTALALWQDETGHHSCLSSLDDAAVSA